MATILQGLQLESGCLDVLTVLAPNFFTPVILILLILVRLRIGERLEWIVASVSPLLGGDYPSVLQYAEKDASK